MKVSINKAIKLRNKLATLLGGVSISATVAVVPTDAQDVREAVKAGAVVFVAAMNKYEQGLTALITLRGLIAGANHSTGADGAMREIIKCELQLKFYEGLQRNMAGGSSDDDVIREIAYRIQVAEKSKEDVFRPQKYNVSVADQSLRDSVREEIGNIKLKIEGLTETRNEINHKSIIELPEDVVSFLRGEKLV